MASFTIPSSSLLKPTHHVFTATNPYCFSSRKMSTPPLAVSVSCSSKSSPSSPSLDNEDKDNKPKKRLSKQSSWETKDSEGDDYLYRLGKEADNMNIAVGARAGVIDPLFAGNFIGKDSDIVFDYRQKVTRSFEYLKGDYIAPVFLGGDALQQKNLELPILVVLHLLVDGRRAGLCSFLFANWETCILAFLVSAGIVLQVLACALYHNSWSMLALITYVILPMPLLFLASSDSSSLFSESDDSWVNATKFLNFSRKLKGHKSRILK